MTVARLADHPGLSGGPGWHEIGFATGDNRWPVARVRVTPEIEPDAERLHMPNAPPAPQRLAVRLSASLVDEAGQVLRIAGRLLIGPESCHAYQFETDAAFDAAAWIDQCAAITIGHLLRQAGGLANAASAGILPELD